MSVGLFLPNTKKQGKGKVTYLLFTLHLIQLVVDC